MPKVFSERLSKLRGVDVVVTPLDGETLEAAEERVIKSNPEKFSGKPDGGKSLAPDLASAKQQRAVELLKQTGGNKKAIDAYNASLDAAGKESAGNQGDIIENLAKQVSRLKQAGDEVETGSGIFSKPMGLYQWAKQKIGLNPELDEYQGLLGSIATQTARKLSGEKGALAEGDVARATGVFPQLPWESTETTGRKWQAVKDLMEGVTGKPIDFVSPGVSSAPSALQLKPTHRFNPLTRQVEKL